MIAQVACTHIKVWETLLKLYPGAALYMKEKLVFLLVAPCSWEDLINILFPAETFLLQRLPTGPSFDHSLYQQFVHYLGAVKKNLVQTCPEAPGAYVITYSNQPDT